MNLLSLPAYYHQLTTRDLIREHETWCWRHAEARETGHADSMAVARAEMGRVEREMRRRARIGLQATVPSRAHELWHRERFLALREHVPVERLIALHFGLYQRSERRDGVWACCPLPDHQDDSPSFRIDPDGQRWWCFGCNRGGDVIDMAMHLYGCRYAGEAAETIERAFGLTPPDPEAEARKPWVYVVEREDGSRVPLKIPVVKADRRARRAYTS